MSEPSRAAAECPFGSKPSEQYGTPEFLDRPYALYDRLLKEAPVAKLPDGETYLVTGYDDITRILQDRDTFSSRRPWSQDVASEVKAILRQGWPSETLLVGEDPLEHTVHKRMVLPAFSRRRLAHLVDRMQVIADELIDGFARDGKVDFVTRFAEPMPLLVVAEIMLIPREETKLFSVWAHDMLAMIAGGLSPRREIECAHSTVKIQQYIKEHVDKRRKNPDDSAISDLLAARDDQGNPLSEGEIINLMCVFLRAGFETTVQLLGNAVLALLLHPKQWEAVRADPSLIPTAIEEVMRAESPVQRLLRHVTRDTRIGDFYVPKGARLFLMVGAANRDPSIFGCPASFDITRKPKKNHLGFGQGFHFCMGAPIARDEARITLQTLIRRLDNLRLAPGANDFRYKDNLIARGLRHLHLEFDVRSAASAAV